MMPVIDADRQLGRARRPAGDQVGAEHTAAPTSAAG